MVARTVQQYTQSGVAHFPIEDKVQTKKRDSCWIRAAVRARQRIESDIIIISRTNALQPYGYAEAIARFKAAREVSADVAFLEGVTTKEQARRVVEDLVPMLCLLNVVESGTPPSMTADKIKALGAKIMIVTNAALAPAYASIKAVVEGLNTTGVLSSGVEDH
ncbi:hypothetical protein AJ78_03552 [Emergomyces pasteurianus Ep9510]|uniref:Uncharacterized protein n=1 Tax=Emergomyces pasteurianus Ep9510 TaxID=1447872 RepID=A0A1J9QM30_9EURO|nr:hypothetical protein AJ78_03552 [Emergomyces pasteurianus Ep9510]